MAKEIGLGRKPTPPPEPEKPKRRRKTHRLTIELLGPNQRSFIAIPVNSATSAAAVMTPAAVVAGRSLAAELGLADRARFVECNVYDAPEAVGEARFDLVLVTWGAIYWLPDVRAWARVVANFLRPGGLFYIAEGHPSALVFDDAAPGLEDRPGWFAPYFQTGPIAIDELEDYANREAALKHVRSYSWMHPLGETVTALVDAGLTLRFLHEHDAVPWRMFRSLEEGSDRMWRWPARPWLPLGFSIAAEKAKI